MNAEPYAVRQEPTKVAGGPWLGLQSYDEGHSPWFFGRTAERDELSRLIKRDDRTVLTVLYGKSGLGKTSLLRAGLFPWLREHDYLPVAVRLQVREEETPEPLLQLTEAIAREVATYCVDTPAPGTGQTLWEYFHGTSFWDRANKIQALTPVLVFDQFEEVFGFGQAVLGRNALYEELSDLIENHIPAAVRERVKASEEGLPYRYDTPKAKVIFSLREDYLGQLQDLKPLIPSLMSNFCHLKPMSGHQAREAVVGPARRAGLDVADEVAERIVRIAAGETQAEAGKPARTVAVEELEVEPVLLSLFCDELNEKRLERGLTAITQELVQGERGRILSDFYGICMASESPEVRRYVEDDLLTKEGHRDTKAVENLPDAVKEAADRLLDLHLLRREERLGRPYVELIHDVLAEPILASRNEWLKQKAVEEEHQRQEEARARERTRLEQERERERKQLERENEKRELQKEREKAKVFMLAAVVCLVFAGLALWQWWEAIGARAEERALRFAAEAGKLGSQPENWAKSALLAIESIKLRLTPETSSAWAETIDRPPLYELQHLAPVTAVAFSPDGKRLATASVNNAAQVWDMGSLGRPATLSLHPAKVYAVGFGSGGGRLITVSGRNGISVWDLDTGKESAQFAQQETVTWMTLSPDARHAAGWGSDGAVWVWDVETGKDLVALKHPEEVTSIALGSDGRRLATASPGDKPRVWNLESRKEPIQLENPVPVTAMAFSADGKRLATAHRGNRLRIWDAERGTQLMERESPAEVSAMAFSPDGKRLATGHRDIMARVWALESATARIRLTSNALVATMTISPDGKHLIAAHLDRTARVWDLETGKEDKVVRLARDGLVTAVAFSADRTRAATAGTDNVVRVWDVENGREPTSLPPHKESVTAVAFSPDGKRLATGSKDRTARVWDRESGRELTSLPPHEESVTAVAFSADGKRLATASADRTARVWDWESGKELIRLTHQQSVTAVAFSADGKRLATASADRTPTARVWDLASSKEPGDRELIRLPHRAPVVALAFSPADERLASVDTENVVRVWPLTADEMVRLACARLQRNLSREDRKVLLRDERYPATCPNFPED